MCAPFYLAIALGMVVTGSISTLATKWADKQLAPGSDGHMHAFDHPFLQATFMFLGEFSCWIMFKIWQLYQNIKLRRGLTAEVNVGNDNVNPILFLAPAMCDLTATSLMFVGLKLTCSSSFLMLRGTVIISTALLSVAFLRRDVPCTKWIGIFIVTAGLVLAGVSGVVFFNHQSSYGPNKILTGDFIFLIAQIFWGMQMVLEEKYVCEINVHPLQVIGWEGIFGMTVLGLLLFPMYYIPTGDFSGNPRGVLEDALDGLYQMGHNSTLAVAQLGSILSIAFFNFFGVTVTRHQGAITRMVLDSIRTVLIWSVSLGVGWQHFQYLQLIGIVILIVGTLVYCNCIPVPCSHSPDDPRMAIHEYNVAEEAQVPGETTSLLSIADSEKSPTI